MLNLLVPGIMTLFGKVVDKTIPDKTQAAQLKAELNANIMDYARSQSIGVMLWVKKTNLKEPARTSR